MWERSCVMWEWLKCPVCDGQGTVSKPPWVAGDQQSWASSGTETYPCWACGGTGTMLLVYGTRKEAMHGG